MRILVISDSHGRNDDIEGVLKQVGDIDMMIHCGDVERGDSYIREIAGCPVVMVAGNNDYYLDLPGEEEIRLGDYKVLVTHGHNYYVNSGVDYLREHALEFGYDVVMYGHTHVPYIEIGDDVTILNPGSISTHVSQEENQHFLSWRLTKKDRHIMPMDITKSSLMN